MVIDNLLLSSEKGELATVSFTWAINDIEYTLRGMRLKDLE